MTNRKRIIYITVAALMLVATACHKEAAVTEDVQYVSELTINFEGNNTKVSATHGSSGLKFAWEDGDDIYSRGSQ